MEKESISTNIKALMMITDARIVVAFVLLILILLLLKFFNLWLLICACQRQTTDQT